MYKRGTPLKFTDFQKMRPGDVVWAQYKENGMDDFKVDAALSIGPYDPDSDEYELEALGNAPGSVLCFAQMGAYNGACIDDIFGEGEIRLYHAIKVNS
jgi:hypothetical protein